MRKRTGILCAAAAVAAGCSKGELVGTYASDTRLSVNSRMQARPLIVPEITCPITMHVTRHEETAISGTFERMACDHPARPTADARGTWSGFALPDGTATITFDRPPLTTENQITNVSLVQCPEEPRGRRAASSAASTRPR